MANEIKWTTAASVALEANGAQITNTSLIAADDTTLTSSNTSNYPLADFILSLDGGLSATTATTGGININLYRQDLNLAGNSALDEGDPSVATSSSYKPHYLGSFILPNSAASATSTMLHVCNLDSVPILPSEQKYWLENSTGVTVNAGWKLTVVPKSFVPG